MLDPLGIPMTASTSEAVACVLAFVAGGVALLVFFGITFGGGSVWPYALWCVTMVIVFALLARMAGDARSIASYGSVPAFLGAALLMMGTLSKASQWWHPLFWPGYALLHYTLLRIGGRLATRPSSEL